MNWQYSADVRLRQIQRYPPIICWMVTIISPTLTVGVLYYALFLQGRSQQVALTVGARVGLMILVAASELAIGLWLHLTRLTVEVWNDSLRIRYAPFSRQEISYSDIESVETRTCNPIREFGGRGVRSGKNGKAYILMGNAGVQLELQGGNRVFIGSMRADQLSAAIKSRMR